MHFKNVRGTSHGMGDFGLNATSTNGDQEYMAGLSEDVWDEDGQEYLQFDFVRRVWVDSYGDDWTVDEVDLDIPTEPMIITANAPSSGFLKGMPSNKTILMGGAGIILFVVAMKLRKL